MALSLAVDLSPFGTHPNPDPAAVLKWKARSGPSGVNTFFEGSHVYHPRRISSLCAPLGSSTSHPLVGAGCGATPADRGFVCGAKKEYVTCDENNLALG